MQVVERRVRRLVRDRLLEEATGTVVHLAGGEVGPSLAGVDAAASAAAAMAPAASEEKILMPAESTPARSRVLPSAGRQPRYAKKPGVCGAARTSAADPEERRPRDPKDRTDYTATLSGAIIAS
jgi:hypothetical protein